MWIFVLTLMWPLGGSVAFIQTECAGKKRKMNLFKQETKTSINIELCLSADITTGPLKFKSLCGVLNLKPFLDLYAKMNLF